MADPFPTYNVLDKRDTPSWNDQTRKAIDERLALQVPDGILDDVQLASLEQLISRVVPHPHGRPPTTTLAMIVRRIAENRSDGYRDHRLPQTAECWKRGLDALEEEARVRHDGAFASLMPVEVDALLKCVASANVKADWGNLPPDVFWAKRLLPDCISAHWAQPSLWSAMGFGGPASPRGYVRLSLNRRDPWEAEEVQVREKGWPRHRAD